MAHANIAPLSEKNDDRYMLHLLVSREDGTQLLAIPFAKDILQRDILGIVQEALDVYENSPLLEALDAALRETSDGESSNRQDIALLPRTVDV